MAMIEEREELMIPPTTTSGGQPILRKAHFLKPHINPTNQPVPPKLCFPSVSLKPYMIKMIRKRVHFGGDTNPQEYWKTWVEKLQKTHQGIWKKAGIFDAIRASTYNILRYDELIFRLAEKWCPETNTFIFPWGEATITLEDVMILGGYSVLGASLQSPCQMSENVEIVKKLYGIYREVKRKSGFSYVSNYHWLKYFSEGSGEMENEALIALWLSRYVLLKNSHCRILHQVFPIAVSLARGNRFALAPAVLALIYRDLSLLREKIMTLISEGKDDGLDLKLLAPFHLVQVWAWERFPRLSPKQISLVPGEPRLACWHSWKPKLDMEFAGDEFLWRPYARSYLKNWEVPKFYSDQEMWVLVNSETDEELLSFARCLMPCELVGMDCLAQYLPHRVAMQFGMDQDIPDYIPRSNGDYNHAWNSYDKPLDGLKFYLPPRLVEGDVTVRYADWLKMMRTLRDEALKVYVRKRRSQRHVKKLSQILHECKEGNSQGTPPPPLSPPLVDNSQEKTIEKSPFFNGMAPESPLVVVNDDGPVSVVNTIIEIDGTREYEQTTKQGDKEKEVDGNAMNVDNGSKHSQGSRSQKDSSPANNETMSVTQEVLSPDMEKLCCTVAEVEQGEAADDAVMKQVNTSVVDVVVVDDDEEENNDDDPFEALLSGIDARITKLETVVPSLKTAKFMSQL